jgi:hypothetical protein
VATQDNPIPTHVLGRDAVRWGIDTLASQKLHPTFVMYLYLRVQHRAGTIADASASSDEVLSLIKMPGNPTKPYYFPLIDRGERTGKPLPSFWRAPNISGSWSPGSLGRQAPAGWLATSGGYTLPDDHVERAFKQMLYEVPVSAVAMGSYFLRNDGFQLSGEPGPADVVTAFRDKFDYPVSADKEFSQLFTTAPPSNAAFNWFEPYESPVVEASPAGQIDLEDEGDA